jgi:hypothetical protein
MPRPIEPSSGEFRWDDLLAAEVDSYLIRSAAQKRLKIASSEGCPCAFRHRRGSGRCRFEQSIKGKDDHVPETIDVGAV